MNRGGLWHVKEATFHLFCTFEEHTRLHCTSLSKPTTTSTEHLFLDKLINSEDFTGA